MFAGAAFTDQADIAVDSDVVDTLVALGVIDGYEDGTFRPDDTVTRAEMAKMIYTVRTGRSDASAYNDDTTSFTDITSHWARGYIKYCQSMGIIAGKSVTSFDPDGTVTTQEAAKMLLVTLGYNAERAGLEGSGWGTKTNALADENGLLEDVNNGTTQGLPRQYAAQLIYNAIFAPTVVYRDDAYTNQNYDGSDNDTIGEKYMGLNVAVGVLTSVTKETNKDTYRLQITQTASQKADSTNGDKDTVFTKVATDYSSIRNVTVKILYKDTDEVYGVFATEDNSTLKGILGDFEIDGGKLKFDGSKYTIASKATVLVNDAQQSDTVAALRAYVNSVAGLNKAYTATAILDDGDNVTSLNVETFSVAKVTYVGSDYVNTTKVSGDTFDRIDTDSSNYPDDLAKDDYVAVYNADNYADGKQVVEKLDLVTGKITSTKNNQTSSDDYSIMIDGTWYESALGVGKNNDLSLSAEVAIAVKDGYVLYVDDANAGSTDVALLVKAVKTNSASGNDIEARLIFEDGKDEVVIAKETGVLANIDSQPDTTIDTVQLVTYKKSGDKYTLTAVDDDHTAGYNDYAAYTDDFDNTVDNNKLTKGDIKYIDNNAVVYVRSEGGDEYNVITGSAMKNWKDTLGFKSYALSNESNGMQYAQIIFADLDDAKLTGSKDITYGYVLENSIQVDEDDTAYMTTLIWNGTENVTLKVEDGNALTEGMVVEYSDNGDGTYDVDHEYALTADVQSMDAAKDKLAVAAVTGFDYDADEVSGTIEGKFCKANAAGSTFAFSGNGKDFELSFSEDDDVVVMFVDTENASGSESGEFQVAQQNTANAYVGNIAFLKTTGGDIVIVVDTQNAYTN